MNHDTALVIVSFDGYSDVWPAFLSCFDTYWANCPFDVYFVSNEKEIKTERLTFIRTGHETNWCDRVEKALVPLEYDKIILLLEDYLIGSPVDNILIEKYMDFFARNDCDYLRIYNNPKTKQKCIDIELGIYPIAENEEYGINLQPSIWKREYLLDTLSSIQGKRSAWDFEVELLKRCSKATGIKEHCFMTERNLLNIHNGVLKGKWFRHEVEYFARNGIIIDTSYRGILSRRSYGEYRLRLVLRELITPKHRKLLKRILRKTGMKFASDY